MLVSFKVDAIKALKMRIRAIMAVSSFLIKFNLRASNVRSIKMMFLNALAFLLVCLNSFFNQSDINNIKTWAHVFSKNRL